jgi:acyl transferase domain-containing protein
MGGMPASPSAPLSRRPVALLFPGQGAQQARMAAGLYEHEQSAAFTAVMDAAFGLLGDDGPRVRADWLAPGPADLLDDVTRAQPLLYAIGCALGRLVESWGIEPAALLGHSAGEMVAATMAGVLAFEDAIRLMRDRMRIFADSPPGGMLAVAASPGELAPYLSGEVALAAVNGPRQALLAGPGRPLAAAERQLRADGVTCRRARARQAFHSPAVADAVARSASGWAATPLRAPERTVYSACLGGILPDGQARDPGFWASQAGRPVLFGPTLDRLLRDGDFLLVEAGPGQGLSALARRHRQVAAGRSAVTAMLPARAGDPAEDRAAARAAAERLRAEGYQIARPAAPAA